MSKRFDELRTVDEIITLYELEPSIKDIYVEGLTDKYIINEFLSNNGLTNIVVKEISSIYLPFENFKYLGVEDNNRGRVIGLAHLIETKSKIDLSRRIICIADSDFNFLNSVTFSSKLLIFTDYTSIEIYAFEPLILKKFFAIVLKRTDLDPEKTINEIANILQELFLIRAVNQRLTFGLELIPFEKLCSIKGDTINFDSLEYINRYLSKGSKISQKATFLSELAKLRKSIPSNTRLTIHGHDFLNVLHWYVCSKGKKVYYDTFLFPGALLGCIESKFLEQQPLFQSIIKRLT